MKLDELQESFQQAIFRQEAKEALNESIVASHGLNPEQRIGIYRNSTQGLLWDYLKEVYSVCNQLLGEPVFRGFIYDVLKKSVPSSSYLHEFGGHIPQLIRQHSAFEDWPWIADVARIEWARHYAWNQANLHSNDNLLSTLTPEQQAKLVMRLQPTTSLIQSVWDVHGIWLAHQENAKESLESININQPCHTLIFRDEKRILQLALDENFYRFLDKLSATASLEQIVSRFGAQAVEHIQKALQLKCVIYEKLAG